jgi:stage II sporulation protein AA (anti-sigma F factor antagonist)
MDTLKSRTVFADDNQEIVIVQLSGYIDQTNCDELDNLISELKDSGAYKIILDLNGIVYLSSAGWGIIVGEVKGIREKGGDIVIANMSPEVYEVFQMLEFYHILSEFPNVEEATENFLSGARGLSVDGILTGNGSHKDIPENNDEEKFQNEAELIQTDEIEIDEDVVDSSVTDEANSGSLLFQSTVLGANERPGDFTYKKDSNVDIAKLPIHEKIKKVVENYPLISLFQIKKMLRDDRFGNEKVSFFKLLRILKEMNLHTRKNRYRYYRSS